MKRIIVLLTVAFGLDSESVSQPAQAASMRAVWHQMSCDLRQEAL
jgi:hypothetical protein